jgi:hypothetical protein
MSDQNLGEPFYAQAISYRKAADLLVAQGDGSIGLPVRFLYSHAFELFFKVFLRLNGLTVEELAKKKYGHNLAVLYDKCKELAGIIKLSSEFQAKLYADRGVAPPTYNLAKQKAQVPGTTYAAKITQLGSLARQENVSANDLVWAEGNKGMLQAQNGNWHAAAASLINVHENLPLAKSEANSAKEAAQLQSFDLKVEANLAKALYVSGMCKQAEPHLINTVTYWPFSKQALSMPCNDVPSGLQYCFNIHSYCIAKQ